MSGIGAAATGLGRAWCGWSEDLTPEEVYEAARGCWKLNAERAGGEQVMLAVHDGTIPVTGERQGGTTACATTF
ncbi:hypothetical protein ACU686_16005, partial [Yinghuangia aomiensis]